MKREVKNQRSQVFRNYEKRLLFISLDGYIFKTMVLNRIFF